MKPIRTLLLGSIALGALVLSPIAQAKDKHDKKHDKKHHDHDRDRHSSHDNRYYYYRGHTITRAPSVIYRSYTPSYYDHSSYRYPHTSYGRPVYNSYYRPSYAYPRYHNSPAITFSFGGTSRRYYHHR